MIKFREKNNILKRIKCFILAGTIATGALTVTACTNQKSTDTSNQSSITSTIKTEQNDNFIDVVDNNIPYEELNKAKNNNNHIGLIIKNTKIANDTVYKNINTVKKIMNNYPINYPILLDVDNLFDLTVDTMAIKDSKTFVEKLSLNGCYAGLYGSEQNLSIISEEYSDFDAMVNTNYNDDNIPDTIPYNMIKLKDGKIIYKVTLDDIIRDNDLNNPANFVPDTSYTVQEGDTLEEIAKSFHIEVDKILYVNNINNIHEITPGQIIYLPFIYDNPTFTSGDYINQYKNKI